MNRSLTRSLVTSSVLAAALAMAPGAAANDNPCDCPADLDGNGIVGFEDLLVVLSTWGPCAGCPADLDGNDVVDFNDLLLTLSTWGPCVFDYGPPRDNAEAEQIGYELLGASGDIILPDDIYVRIDRDLDLIRTAVPALASQPHTPAWAPAQIILQKVAGADLTEYDALNECLQLVSENNFALDFWLLTFPAPLNVPRVAAIYTRLDSINFAEPNGIIGGENFWTPAPMAGGLWRWTIDDGFTDCFDGCDCHRVYTIDVDAAGNVNVVSINEFGAPWCDFSGG